jgi:hypothetical protein
MEIKKEQAELKKLRAAEKHKKARLKMQGEEYMKKNGYKTK